MIIIYNQLLNYLHNYFSFIYLNMELNELLCNDNQYT